VLLVSIHAEARFSILAPQHPFFEHPTFAHLLSQASAAGVEPPPEEESTAAAPPPSPKRPGRSKKATSSNGKGEERELPMPGPGQLRRAISDGADHHLLVRV